MRPKQINHRLLYGAQIPLRLAAGMLAELIPALLHLRPRFRHVHQIADSDIAGMSSEIGAKGKFYACGQGNRTNPNGTGGVRLKKVLNRCTCHPPNQAKL